jgi:two-component system response regulator HupR/HoxA
MAAPEASAPTDIDLKSYPVLFVDDEPDIVETFRFNFEDEFTVLGATSGSEALAVIAHEPVAVLVSDQRMPEMDGLEVIRRALDLRPDVVPIILTGYTDVDALVSAINLGHIYRYIAKPWDRRELRMTITRAIERHHLTAENGRLASENARLLVELQRTNERLTHENRYLKEREAEESGFGAIIGRSKALESVRGLARRVLETSTTVLIQGESGTGKELVARAIHYEGTRRSSLFVPLNCGAVTDTLLESTLFGARKGAYTGAVADRKGLFEIADGGTLFLDEISEASPAFQVHLLRVLQEQEVKPVGAARPVKVDVRIIAATNRDLREDVKRGRFREDLFFRLCVFPIRLPPLSERPEDISLLVRLFAEKYAAKLRRPVPEVAPEALAALERHDFPGNVRELENMIERALLLSAPDEVLTEAHFDLLPEEVVAAQDGNQTLQEELNRVERELITRTLDLCAGNKTHAARRLGLTYRGFLKKMQRFGMPTGGRDLH